MSFRKYGGLNYAAKNNIVRNNYSSSDNQNITNELGQINSRIVAASNIDLITIILLIIRIVVHLFVANVQ